jgi:hypothetical protein
MCVAVKLRAAGSDGKRLSLCTRSNRNRPAYVFTCKHVKIFTLVTLFTILPVRRGSNLTYDSKSWTGSNKCRGTELESPWVTKCQI